jgi:hypothetical protein
VEKKMKNDEMLLLVLKLLEEKYKHLFEKMESAQDLQKFETFISKFLHLINLY